MEEGAADHVAGGADEAHLHARRLQDGLDEVAGGGLALGAGESHHLHLPGGMAVELRAHGAEGRPDVFNQNLRDIKGQQSFHHQGGSAVFHRLLRIIMGVKPRAGNAEEKAVLHLFPAVHKRPEHLGVSLDLNDLRRAAARQIG